jgi:hypothetical protein
MVDVKIEEVGAKLMAEATLKVELRQCRSGRGRESDDGSDIGI